MQQHPKKHNSEAQPFSAKKSKATPPILPTKKVKIAKDELKGLREKAREVYNSLKPVRCPYLNASVNFTSEGFNHIKYKGDNSFRPAVDQKMRYKLLRLAPEVLRSSKNLQEYEEQAHFITERHKSKSEKVLRTVHYYGFIAIIGDNPESGWKVKVIVRKIGQKGQFHFWSIIPNWLTRKSKEGNNTILRHHGNMEED